MAGESTKDRPYRLLRDCTTTCKRGYQAQTKAAGTSHGNLCCRILTTVRPFDLRYVGRSLEPSDGIWGRLRLCSVAR
jgi:hypothetical protein